MSIADLDPATPSALSNAGLGDDQIRLVKQALIDSLGGVDGPVNSGSGNPLATAAELTDLFDRLTAVEATAGAAGVFVPGMIAIWYGSGVSVPTGWKICDGQTWNGIVTPDLTAGLFIRNPGDGYAWGQEGGATSGTTDTDGAYAGGTTGSTSLTVAQLPDLSAVVQVKLGSSTSNSSDDHDNANYVARSASAGGAPSSAVVTLTGFNGDGHTHSIPAGSNHTHTVDTVPPFMALYYICYVGV